MFLLEIVISTPTHSPHLYLCAKVAQCTTSPTATGIPYDASHAEQLPKERTEAFNIGDFAYEPMPNSSMALELFVRVRCLIAPDGHMRNLHKNYRLLSPKDLIKPSTSSRWAVSPSPISDRISTNTRNPTVQ
ncbi:hypothetical protein V8E52_004724 [Russula decolorans]